MYIQFMETEEIGIGSSANGRKEGVDNKKPFIIVRSLRHGLTVKKDQIIKLGKTEMIVNEVVLNIDLKK